MPHLDQLDVEGLREAMEQVGATLEQLSALDQTPNLFSRRLRPRTSTELAEIGGSRWLDAIIHEQGWLYLDDEIPESLYRDSPQAAALRLFELLGKRGHEGESCLSPGPLGPTLTVDGASRLIDRLETAVQHALSFAEQCEESGTKVATEAWADAWDASLVPSDDLGPINAKTEPRPILNLAFLATEGRLVLSPSYQRDDVWPIRRSQELIVSILRGIPLPSIVLLHVPARAGEAERYEVVDGKQRLTSILRFMGKHPKAIAKVAELEQQFPNAGFQDAFDRNYRRFRKLWNEHFPTDKLCAELERRYMLPFPLRNGSKLGRIQRLAECEGKYYTEIRSIEINSNRRKASEIFEHGTEYNLAVITFVGATPRQIHEVFHLYNEQTTRLNAEEIRNAVYHEVDLARALLAASESSHDAESLLPSASVQLKSDLRAIREALADSSIPTGRYRKAKVLGWMFATAFSLVEEGGELSPMSTANQINNLLERCILSPTSNTSAWIGAPLNRLASRAGLESCFAATKDAIEMLTEQPLWASTFIDDGKGARWQDLQFVAALTALFIASVSLGEKFGERVTGRARDVHGKTGELFRPLKSQTKSQWAFIGHAVLEILDALDLEHNSCSREFVRQFDHDPMPALRAARSLWRAEYAARRGGRST
jgi:hypothetical protein